MFGGFSPSFTVMKMNMPSSWFKNRRFSTIFTRAQPLQPIRRALASSAQSTSSIGFIIMINADLKESFSAEEINSRILEIAEELTNITKIRCVKLFSSPSDGSCLHRWSYSSSAVHSIGLHRVSSWNSTNSKRLQILRSLKSDVADKHVLVDTFWIQGTRWKSVWKSLLKTRIAPRPAFSGQTEDDKIIFRQIGPVSIFRMNL